MTEERKRGEEQSDEALTAAAGDDLSAPISVSGIGGEKVGESEGEDTGLDEVVDGASRTAWGREGRPDDEWSGA